MYRKLKKFISVILSTVMCSSAVSAFAETTDIAETSDIISDINTISVEGETELTNANTEPFTEMMATDFQVELFSTTIITSGECGENLTWVFDENSGILTISGTGAMQDVPSNSNPVWYNAHILNLIKKVIIEDGVTSIGDRAFRQCNNVTSISIPDSVISIGDYAFGDCKNLTNINIPDSLTHIGSFAFINCSSLKNITIPEGVTQILDSTFYNSGIESIKLPDTLTSIGYEAFANCQLKSIEIPDSVTYLGGRAFFQSALESVRIGRGIKYLRWGGWAFNNCSNLKTVYLTNSLTKIGTYNFDCDMNITDVYFDGTEAEWNNITIGDWNGTLKKAAVHYLREIVAKPIEDQYYLGNPVEPKVNIVDMNLDTNDETPLVEGIDYTVSYINNTSPGVGTAVITYIGNYANSINEAASVDFNILNGLVKNFSISNIANCQYTGEAQEPKPIVKNGGVALTEGVDYTLSYADNVNAGTASVIVTGLGNYKGSKTKNFDINPCSMSNVSVSTIPTQNFTGSEIKVYPEVTFGGAQLQQGVDYDVSFQSNRAVGNASVMITGKGNFVGSKVVSFKIVSTSNGTWDGPNLYYNFGYAPDYYDDIVNALTLTAPDGTVFRGAEIGDIELKIYRYDEENDYDEEIGYIPDTYSYGDGSLGIEIGDSICAYVYSFNADNITTEHGFPSWMVNSSGNYYTMTVLPDPQDVGGFDILGSYDGRNFDGLDYLFFEYTGKPCEPIIALHQFVGGEGFEMVSNENTFKTYYDNNVNAGTATIRIEGLGKIFSGTTTATFKIEAADIANAIIEDVPDKTYSGIAYTPKVSMTYNSVDLVEGQDYTLSYSNNTNAGTATITIKGIGNFTGTTTKTFKINPADISNASFSIEDEVMYMGAPLTPEVGVIYGGKALVEGTDFSVSYFNNNAEGTGYANISGKGNYTGTKQLSFEIGPYDPGNIGEEIPMSEVSINVEESFVYDGSKKEPVPTVTYVYENQETGVRIPYTLVEGEDFEISGYNDTNVNAGTAEVIVNGLGVFVGTNSGDFEISAADISVATLEAVANQTYSGSAISPDLSLSYNGMNLVEGSDYSVSYSNNENVGTANVSISGLGNYSGTTSTTFAIEAKLLSNDDISTSAVDAQLFTGSAITPEPEVSYNDVVLEKDKDYTLSYENNINVGTATINVTFIGNYTGSASTTFQIVPRTISDADVSNGNIVIGDIPAETYSGAAIKPEPKVSFCGVEFVKDKDYTLSYENNVNAGNASIKVDFIGNFEGSVAKSFVINPKSGDLITIAPISDKVFTGNPIEPDIEATDN